jgi:predicted Fe-S protein YdhL (DUF1289 family)
MSICALAADGFCSGCLRTLDEIAGWAVMSAAEQWQVMARLERRLAQRDGSQPLER